MLSLILFDFDGTLVNTERTILACVREVCREFSLPDPPDHAVRELIGLPLEATMQAIAEGHSQAPPMTALVSAYRRRYPGIADALSGEYGGVTELLEELSESSVRLGIATSKGSKAIQDALCRFGWTDFFEHVETSQTVARPKPDPAMLLNHLALAGVEAEDALMVGDALADIEMAKRAAVPSCAVTWGMGSPAALAALAPSFIVTTVAELRARLFGMLDASACE
ncbi:MAG: HAD family hydrolase [Planctomycetota bacterium]